MSLAIIPKDDENRIGMVLERGVVTIDSIHAAIHRGRAFDVSVVDLALPNDGTSDLLIQAPGADIRAQFLISGGCGGDARGEIFEAPTYSAAGAAVPAYHRCRCAVGLSTLQSTVTGNPTVTDTGTKIYDTIIYGGSGGNAVGGTGGLSLEFGLAADTDYLIRLTNISGQVHIANMNMLIYELDTDEYPVPN